LRWREDKHLKTHLKNLNRVSRKLIMIASRISLKPALNWMTRTQVYNKNSMEGKREYLCIIVK
jgi:hypothetical protein